MPILCAHINDPSLTGFIYRPDSDGPSPGILLLHGSEGGNGDFWSLPGESGLPTGEETYTVQMAKHFAALGYVAFAFSYFHASGAREGSRCPNELVHVDLERTAQALNWLKQSLFVKGMPVGIWGGSRGAEHALLLASMMNPTEHVRPDVIIAHSPSDFAYPGLSLEGAQALSDGQAFPNELSDAWRFGPRKVSTYTPIEIEKIATPMLITYGSDDKIWGPSVKPENLYKSLTGFGVPAVHLEFSNEDDPEECIRIALRSMPGTSPSSVFLHFLDEGHSPAPGSRSAQLSETLSEIFLRTYLKPR